jgi:predicted ArsR family transcriptional regulator
MESEDLGEEVLRFIDQYIDTVPHLEALLLLWQSAGSDWNLEQLAARIYVAPPTAKGIVDDLMRHGMVVARGSSPVSYGLDPEWDAGRQILGRVAHTYSRQLTRVATLIHSKGSRSVRDFARAFKLKDKQ